MTIDPLRANPQLRDELYSALWQILTPHMRREFLRVVRASKGVSLADIHHRTLAALVKRKVVYPVSGRVYPTIYGQQVFFWYMRHSRRKAKS